jgi:pimeloyl-ACP methyl ester carboxylesterase
MKKQSFTKFRNFCLAAVGGTALGLAACTMGQDIGFMRVETAKRLATPSFMFDRVIPAAPFALTVYERVREPGSDATLYIEGDGQSWLSRRRPSMDPTPTNPVALHLATRDNGPNVIYLARPCQYSKMLVADTPCDTEWWTSKRLSTEVLNAMNAALDDIKAHNDIRKFNLVGYSGGAGIAVLLASERNDIASIRTVAGNLDHGLFTGMHKISPMDGSLDPITVAAKVADIPQHHFIGEWDDVVPVGIYDSFRAAAGPSTCMRSSMVAETTHEKGWVNKWPEMLQKPVDCRE